MAELATDAIGTTPPCSKVDAPDALLRFMQKRAYGAGGSVLKPGEFQQKLGIGHILPTDCVGKKSLIAGLRSRTRRLCSAASPWSLPGGRNLLCCDCGVRRHCCARFWCLGSSGTSSTSSAPCQQRLPRAQVAASTCCSVLAAAWLPMVLARKPATIGVACRAT